VPHIPTPRRSAGGKPCRSCGSTNGHNRSHRSR
jgi:hypothetical protein